MKSSRVLSAAVTALLAAALAPAVASASSPTARGFAPAPPAMARSVAARGVWQVVSMGSGRYAVSWTSPSRLPMTSDRPTITGAGWFPGNSGTRRLEGLGFGPSLVAADRRTVRAVVTSDTPPKPAGLDVMLSGDRLDVPGKDLGRVLSRSSAASEKGTRAAAEPLLGVDPGVAGPFPITTSDYTLPSVKLPGMPRPIEMVGHVVEPTAAAATGPRPLVLFMHGRHEVCYRPGKRYGSDDWPCKAPEKEIPSHLGYVYIQKLLASQGYTTVSVRVNGINAQDYRLPDGGATARAAIVQRHLDYWAGIAASHQTDLQHVVLVGHSRGGEGVDRASIEIPLSAPYRIAGQVLIAPTDFGSQTAPYVPTVTILPYCDGDVSDLEGQRFTDTARDVVDDDPTLKSSVLVMGANHNFFNSEWTPATSVAPSSDDWYGPKTKACGKATAARLGYRDQRKVGATYVAGAVHLFADGDQAYLPLYDGSSVTVPSIGRAVVQSAAVGGGRTVRRPGLDASRSLPHGAQTDLCTGQIDYRVRPGLCGSGLGDVVTPHWLSAGDRSPARRFLEMSWTAPGQSGGLGFDHPLDLGARTLELRTIVDPDYASVGFRVRLTDADGHEAVVTPEGGSVLRSLLRAPSVTKLWAQAVRVDPAAATGVDLTRVTRVELVSTSARGRVWVADVAAAPSTLPAVPLRRAATIDLGSRRQVEGDHGTVLAQIPYRVRGSLTRPARFTVATAGQAVGSLDRYSVDLAPGQTSGVISVPYDADTIDDLSPAFTSVATWPVSNVMTDDWVSELRVVDDDPAPRITAKVLEPTVSEGEAARVEIRLSRRVDYSSYAVATVVNKGRHRLTAGDVPQSWLREHAIGPVKHPGDPLRASVFAALRQGRTRTEIAIPIARDGYREPAESLRLLIRVNGRLFVRTIYIAPSKGATAPPTTPPSGPTVTAVPTDAPSPID